MIKRKEYFVPNLQDDSDGDLVAVDGREERTDGTGNVISSESDTPFWEGYHYPVIDLDYDCELIPSSTGGHYHLYIHKAISWSKYKNLLEALHAANLIGEGFYRMAIARGATFVRKPEVKKENAKVT